MKPAQRLWRRLRRWTLLTIAAVLIGAAGLLALSRLLVPWIVSSPDVVAAWLSDRIGREVQLNSVSAHWDGPGPVLELGGLRIFDKSGGETAISLGRARVQVDVYAWLWPGRHLIRDFLLVDARIELIRETTGLISVGGFGGSAAQAGGIGDWLAKVGHVGLTGGQVGFVDRASGAEFELDQVELRLRQSGSGLSLGLLRRSRDGGGQLRLVLDNQGALQWPPNNAELYLEAEQFPVSDLAGLGIVLGISLENGQLDGQQWSSWRDSQLQNTQGDWRSAGLVLTAPAMDLPKTGHVAPNLHLPEGRLVLQGQRGSGGMALDLRFGDGLEAEDLQAEISARLDTSGRVQARASRLPVALVSALVQLTRATPEGLRSAVYASQPDGELSDLSAEWSRDGWQLHADLKQLRTRSGMARSLRLDGVDGTVHADGQGLVLEIDRVPVRYSMPGVFREAIEFQELELLLGAAKRDGNWVFEVPAAHVQGQGFSADLALRVDLDPEAGPLLQVQAHVPGAEIEAAKAFWTINKMPPKTVAWLDRALGVGRVTRGDVVFRGPVKRWPFAGNEGRFEARFEVAGADLNYHADWPEAKGVNAEAAFINNSLEVYSATGELLGNRVVSGSGGIASLKNPVLQLSLVGEGDAGNWLRFLKSTPLQRSYDKVLFGMSMSGPAKVAAQFSIPLRKDLEPGSLTGQVELHGVQFLDTKWDLDYADVQGHADYSASGFKAENLGLNLAGEPARLSLAVGSFCADPEQQLEASMIGRLSAQALFGHQEQLTSLLNQISGSADWQAALNVPRAAAQSAGARSMLRYQTDLAGIAIALPEPLGKAADAVLPLALEIELPAAEGVAPDLRMDIGSQARLYAALGTRDSDFHGQLQLGSQTAKDLPSRGLRVTGATPEVDLLGWTSWIFGGPSGAPVDSILSDLDLRIGSRGDRLQLDRSEGPWLLKVQGPMAEGTVRFEGGEGRSAAVVAEFDHLYVPEPDDGAASLALTPAMVPTLHFRVRDLRVGDARLGEARLEAFASADGLRVDLLEARSPVMEIHASGDWRATTSGAESRFKIRMLSEDLGGMMTGLGFAGVIAGGQTLAQIDARWRGAPFAFALERLTGTIDISVGQGRFLDVDPGAGRIFGLLSLRELPRRLTLDFRDLFQSGMSFDRIEGRFQLADGNAWTENLTVRGPAADILIIGRTGLASRDYDQQVMVAPRMSGVLPVIGGLAAGPVGAAAGFLAQGMVQQDGDIEKASRVHYSVAGSWEKPVVARLTPVRPDAPPRRRREEAADEAG